MIIDAHFHQWRLARGDYDWITQDLTPIYRDFDTDDWRAEQDPKISGGVLIQCTCTEAETNYLLNIANAHNDILAVVGWVDLDSPSAANCLARYSKTSKLAGIRPMVQDIDDPGWLLKPQVQTNISSLADFNLCFDALVLPCHLKNLYQLCHKNSNVKFVIDHGAKPNIRSGQLTSWQQDMSKLAQLPNVHCKISGLLTEAGEDAGVDELAPIVTFLLQQFGPEKLIWGSDWPVLKLASDYKRWLNISRELLAKLNDAQRHRIFAANALEFYNIQPGPAALSNKPLAEATL